MPNQRHDLGDRGESHEHVDEQHLAKAEEALSKAHRKQHELPRKTEGLEEPSTGKPHAPQKHDHG
jgi:hypothetical protein